jgi:thiol-disulfide isomerase/thioredoxin
MKAIFGSILGWVILTGLVACGEPSSPAAHADGGKEQVWYAMEFIINDSVRAQAYLHGTPSQLSIINGRETIELEQISATSYRIPVFDGIIAGAWNADSSQFLGTWTDKLQTPNVDTRFVMNAIPEAPGFTTVSESAAETYFSGTFINNESGAWNGSFVIQTEGDNVLSTVKTGTGDLRHLYGTVQGNHYNLSTFDGAHLYALEFDRNGESIVGDFHSFTGYTAEITGTRLARAPTTNPLRIQATGDLEFTVVVDADSTVENWTADRFTGKVTLIDLMGTWCPNCMDASRMMLELKQEFPELQLASVAFERESNPTKVFERFERYKADMGIAWPMVYGGPAKKKETSYKMNFLTGFESFPTTLILDKQGKIAYVHTGFNGPATGNAYIQEQKFFRAAIGSLMNQ